MVLKEVNISFLKHFIHVEYLFQWRLHEWTYPYSICVVFEACYSIAVCCKSSWTRGLSEPLDKKTGGLCPFSEQYASSFRIKWMLQRLWCVLVYTWSVSTFMGLPPAPFSWRGYLRNVFVCLCFRLYWVPNNPYVQSYNI